MWCAPCDGRVNNGRGLILVKVIVETCYLSNKLKKMACKIVEGTGADFVKTSTGFGPEGATVHDVELLRDALSERVAVKASGGVRTYDDVVRLINAGAARIGTSCGDRMMRESSPPKKRARPAPGLGPGPPVRPIVSLRSCERLSLACEGNRITRMSPWATLHLLPCP